MTFSQPGRPDEVPLAPVGTDRTPQELLSSLPLGGFRAPSAQRNGRELAGEISNVAPASQDFSAATHVRLDRSIGVRGCRTGYGRIEILHGVDLEVPAGSVFMLLGPNGSGKTTLMKALSGRLKLWVGSVSVGGNAIGKHTTVESLARAGVCSIPEGRGIFPNLTVRENLRMWTFRGGFSMAELEERAYGRFSRLKERRDQLAGSMSGGEQQMLAISRALAGESRVLLLDELSMGLAPLVVAELFELVGQLAESGITIVVVEQFVTTAMSVATHAAIMVHGVIRSRGTPEEMAEAALSAYLSGGETNVG